MKLILLSAILAISTNSFSTDIKWTEIIKTGKRVPPPMVIGQDGNTIYLVRYESRNKPILSTYKTTNLGSTKDVPLVLEYKGKKIDLIGGYMINNSPVLATSFYNKKGKIIYYFAHRLSTNLKVGPPILLGSIPIFGGNAGLSFLAGVGTKVGSENIFNVSENGENAFCIFPQGDRKNPSNISKSILLDKELEKISNEDITLPYLSENFRVINQELGNDGRFYILGYNVYEEKKGVLRTTQIFRDDLWLYAVDSETGDLEKTKVETEVDITQMTMKVSPKGTIFVTGLTTKEGLGMNGAICIIYDNELMELNRTLTPFEEDFVKTTYSERELQKQEKKEKKASKRGKEAPKAKLYNYDMQHVVESADGSFTVFAEQYYVIVTTTTTSNGNGGTTTTTTYHYYYNDVIAINYDRDGLYQWKNVIEKRQHSINDGGFYSSFFPIVDENNVGLIFNTKEIENLDIDELSRMEKKQASRKTVCMNVTLRPDGSVNKRELFNFDESEKLAIAPKYSSQTSTGDVIIFARSRRGSKIGVIRL